jgi:hypothetical protein
MKKIEKYLSNKFWENVDQLEKDWKDYYGKDTPINRKKILWDSMVLLMRSEIKGSSVDETINIFKDLKVEESKDLMFETVLTMFCMTMSHYLKCTGVERGDHIRELEYLIHNAGLSLD